MIIIIFHRPRINVISSYDFVIKATDSDGMTVNTTLPVAVQYQHETQKVNFEISLHMKPVEDKNLTVTFQLELLDHIAHLYGDENTTHINVRNVTCNPFVLTWTNSSLSSDTCDNTTILNLLNVSNCIARPLHLTTHCSLELPYHTSYGDVHVIQLEHSEW